MQRPASSSKQSPRQSPMQCRQWRISDTDFPGTSHNAVRGPEDSFSFTVTLSPMGTSRAARFNASRQCRVSGILAARGLEAPAAYRGGVAVLSTDKVVGGAIVALGTWAAWKHLTRVLID